MSEILRNLLNALVTIFLAITLIFIAIRAAPGDPVENILGPEATQEEIEDLRQQLSLNLPIHQQYVKYLKGLFKGELGESLYSAERVEVLILDNIAPTLIIAIFSITFSTIWGLLVGLYAGSNADTAKDRLVRVFSLLGLSFPIFSLAPLLILLFSIELNLLPVSEWGSVRHAILPILTLVIPLSTIVSRIVRTRFLEESNSLWVTVLKSKGMGQIDQNLRVIKVLMPTVLNIVAIQLSIVLAGTIITETIFDIPGIGMILFEGLQNRDYPVVQGVIIYSTIIYMAVYFFVDFLNKKLDPRISS